uniref:Ground-like domain-containing protein n=1 Tax=Rhabditophanes sp. KR3021 TaxID=114890 RepID=A0AC35TFZ5_9BILA
MPGSCNCPQQPPMATPCFQASCSQQEPCLNSLCSQQDPCQQNPCSQQDPCQKNPCSQQNPCQQSPCSQQNPCNNSPCQNTPVFQAQQSFPAQAIFQAAPSSYNIQPQYQQTQFQQPCSSNLVDSPNQATQVILPEILTPPPVLLRPSMPSYVGPSKDYEDESYKNHVNLNEIKADNNAYNNQAPTAYAPPNAVLIEPAYQTQMAPESTEQYKDVALDKVFGKREMLLESIKNKKTHSIADTNNFQSLCNDPKLAKLMAQNIVTDITVSKLLISDALTLTYNNTKFDIICAIGDFSYSILARQYCEATRDKVTCFAFI